MNLRFPRAAVARATVTYLLFLGLAWARAAHGQEVQFIVSPLPEFETLEDVHLAAFLSDKAFTPNSNVVVAPTAKPDSTPVTAGHSFYSLDRVALTVGIIQGASELFDGVTTRYFIHHCSSCTERDPASRFLLGSRPTWAGMIAAGSIEATAVTYTYKNLRRSPHRAARISAPFVPLVLIGIHIIEGSRNLPLKNTYYCVDPGLIVVGDTCVLPSLAPGTGLPPDRLPGRIVGPLKTQAPHLR